MFKMESLSSEEDINSIPLKDEDEEGSVVFQPQNPYPREKEKKKSCKSNCINGSLLPLKALLFIFYGGVGTIATWLNHTVMSSRFTEGESLLVYGVSALLSSATPIIFGLLSDKTASPKKVLGICLFLAGLLYPLIMAVPPAEPYRYQDRLKWCEDAVETSKPNNSNKGFFLDGKKFSSSPSCLPNKLVCGSKTSELITPYAGCSLGCSPKLLIFDCHYTCSNARESYPDYEDGAPMPQALITDYENQHIRFNDTPAHVCVRDNPNFKYKNLCFAFDSDMHEITLKASGLSGYTDHDGKCHYPLKETGDDGEQRYSLYCPRVSADCEDHEVHCSLRWDTEEDDQWVCQSDFMNWMISLLCYIAIHTLGTMLVISGAGLLNSAVLSMSHEHSGSFGCQYTYAVLGFALVPPGTLCLFEFIHSTIEIPWNLEYLGAFSIWLFASAFLVFCLPYHAEWVPKKGSVISSLHRWSARGHTTMFFGMLLLLGLFQVLNDVLSFHQIKNVDAPMLLIALCSAASVAPALIFICRVEKVVEFCGYQNLFSLSLVNLSLQFTGYAYLENGIEPMWSFLLKAMETFSVMMVWVTASYTTYSAGPRSLAATCQTIIVTIYCCFGRGIGGVLGYLLLQFIPKDLLLKILSLFAAFICVLFLIIHYCWLKPFPYTKPYEFDRPGSAAPSGQYTPLKLINGKKDKNLAKDEDLEINDL